MSEVLECLLHNTYVLVNRFFSHIKSTLFNTRYNDKNSLYWKFECHKTIAQEMTVNEILCKNIALKLQATYVLDICYNSLTEAVVTNIQNIWYIRKCE